MFRMQGIYAPIAASFESDMGELAVDKIIANVKKYNETKLSGLVVMGSNGEFVFLSKEEKLLLIKTIRENHAPEKHMIVGCGCESTRETIELCKEAAALGADAALVISPNYYKKAMQTDRVIEQFFTDVADASPIPVILYNMPGNSGINIPANVTIKLAKHPNIIGEKDSGGNIVQITEKIYGTENEEFVMFAGSTSFLAATTIMGGDGGTLALANVLPDECVKLYELAKAGDLERAVKAQKILMAPNAAVTSQFGIGGLKVALDHLGFFGGSPRKPLLPQSEENAAKVIAIIDKAKAEMAAL
ncbi:MAG: dihydrodipicolinate synthase family protein [Oscillospiraceae bacterium]|nr:dihydrodipicolinate synthase family protein [Oscillospiraceae bacterium]